MSRLRLGVASIIVALVGLPPSVAVAAPGPAACLGFGPGEVDFELIG